MPRPTLPRSVPGRACVVLLVWFVVVLAAWGLRPLTDNVPVRCTDPEAAAAAESAGQEDTAGETAPDGSDGSDGSDADANRRPRHLRDEDGDIGCTEDELSSVSASCHSPVSRNGALRGDAPTPDPGWELERSPCRLPVRSAGQLMAVNTLVFVAGTAVMAVWWNRRRTATSVSTVAGPGREPGRNME